MSIPKKIVIIHYHLRKGGVTSVIKSQAESLSRGNSVLIISGEAPEEFIGSDVAVVPELGYSGAVASTLFDTSLKITKTVHRHFGSACDLFHFHNPTLVKNRHLPGVIRALSSQGARILLQIHDFAEDGRTGSYMKEGYPENAHYATVNTRDHHVLLGAGVAEECLHYIPNCVRGPRLNPEPYEAAENKLYLYPVRAIRRKNVGEAVLLSLFVRDGDRIGITLPALSGIDLDSYEDWKLFVRERGLPFEFDLGLRYTFSDLVKISKCFISTSITEGFGFAFLEPWLHARPLLGRLLPDICNDFTSRGVYLGDLYESLIVPSALIDTTQYITRIENDMKTAEKTYGRVPHPERFVSFFTGMLENDRLDFGMLPEEMQADIIHRTAADPRIRETILAANERLAALSNPPDFHSAIERNAAVIAQEYSTEQYGALLNAVYEKVMTTAPSCVIDRQKLVASFLRPENFFPLKWGSYNG